MNSWATIGLSFSVNSKSFSRTGLPGEHSRGTPYQGGYADMPATADVDTIRYWDERWYCYMVGDNVIVDQTSGN